MRKLAPGVFVETRYPGVHVGAVASGGHVLLIDAPLRSEDSRDWQHRLAAHGQLRFLTLLDAHPDRCLGARAFDVPLVAHDLTRERIAGWPETFKGGAPAAGSEADRLRKLGGLRKALPELTFVDTLQLHVGEILVELWHRRGPAAGAAWLVVPSARIVFVGDLIWTGEPPYLGEADVKSWLSSLADLRSPRLRGFRIFSGRNGLAPLSAATRMTRILRRLEPKLRPLQRGHTLSDESAAALASQILRAYRVPASRRHHALLRLQSGLLDYQRQRQPV